MDDLRQRFANLDAVPMPDLHGDIERRAATQVTVVVRPIFVGKRASTRRSLRLAIVALALIALVGAIAVGSGVVVLPRPPAPSVLVGPVPSVVPLQSISPLPSATPLPSPSVASTPGVTIGRFVRSGALLEGRMWHAATLLPDGRVLVAGGEGSHVAHAVDYLLSIEVWDAASGGFGTGGTMSNPIGWDPLERVHMQAFPTADGRVVLVPAGCACRPLPATPAEIWNPADGSLQDLANLQIARYGFTSTRLADGRVIIAGGNRSLVASSTKTAEVWDPVTDTVLPSKPTTAARYGAVATLLADGRVLIVGGSHQLARGAGDDTAVLSADLWHPESARFTKAFSLNAPIGYRTRLADGALAVTLRDGRVLVLDGRRARVWDPTSGDGLVASGSFLVARYEYTATVLDDGRVLVIGGFDAGDRTVALRTTELWDPETGRFEPGPELEESRGGHSATLLPDGRVLVIGGAGQLQLALSPRTLAEIWEP